MTYLLVVDVLQKEVVAHYVTQTKEHSSPHKVQKYRRQDVANIEW